MSENNEDCIIELKHIPNATTITNESLESFPNVKYFFETLVNDVNIESRKVGKSFKYPKDVEKYRYFSAHGLFMDYFIRKHLSNQHKINLMDSRTENVLENHSDYEMCDSLYNAIKKHYDIFKDPETKALDIVKSIKIVAMSHLIFFNYPIPRHEYTVNEDNLREIIKYFESLPYHTVDLNPKVGCKYFNADADLIFDNDVIYEIKTSKFHSITRNEYTIPLNKFYQTIIYGFGLYKMTGIKIKKFKIYNPLLGDEYSIYLDQIDFELFEKVLKYDVEIYSRLIELISEEVDLSLFPGVTNK